MNAKKRRTKNRRRAHKLADQAWEAADAGNYDLAVKIVRRAVNLNPGNPVLWNDQGMLVMQLGNETRAAESFQAAITLAPDFSEAYARLAEIRVRQGLVREAVALQQAAVRHAPESTRYALALSAYRAMAEHADLDRSPMEHDRASVSTSAVCPIELSLRRAKPNSRARKPRSIS